LSEYFDTVDYTPQLAVGVFFNHSFVSFKLYFADMMIMALKQLGKSSVPKRVSELVLGLQPYEMDGACIVSTTRVRSQNAIIKKNLAHDGFDYLQQA
jgi:hypothetical protein